MQDFLGNTIPSDGMVPVIFAEKTYKGMLLRKGLVKRHTKVQCLVIHKHSRFGTWVPFNDIIVVEDKELANEIFDQVIKSTLSVYQDDHHEDVIFLQDAKRDFNTTFI